MFVCLCNGVSDTTIRECIKKGADSVDSVAFQTGAGTCCGGCRPLIETMVSDHKAGNLKDGEYEYNQVRK